MTSIIKWGRSVNYNRPLARLTIFATALLVSCVATQASAAVEDSSWKVSASPHQAGRPALKEPPRGNAAIVRTVIDAVGLIRFTGPRETTATVNRLRWRGDGDVHDASGTYKATYSYGMSLAQVAAREDIQRAAANGSGGRQVRVVHGELAWNESTPGVPTGFAPDQALKRRMQFWRTPFGIAKALSLAQLASIKVTESESSAVQLDFKIEGVPTQVSLDSDYRPWRVVQVIGKDKFEDRYTDYKDFTEYGLMFAGHTVETINGKPYLDIHSHEADAGEYLVFVPPAGGAH
jgi:hypothetical protein